MSCGLYDMSVTGDQVTLFLSEALDVARNYRSVETVYRHFRTDDGLTVNLEIRRELSDANKNNVAVDNSVIDSAGGM